MVRSRLTGLIERILSMPKYELMYILSSAVSDNDVPAVSSEVDKFITDSGGKLLASEMLGKKKLAYPIKKTRNGFYVLETFQLEGATLQALDNKLRSMEPIIRYLVVNLEEQEKRAVKDRAIQEKMRSQRKIPKPEPAAPEITLSEKELEQKIEQAIVSDDLAK
jgi:small subunit ribosomal protein S6